MYPERHDLNYQSQTAVAFFSVPYEALNNWSAHQVTVWGHTFPTAEHAFQWKKYSQTAPEVAVQILAAPSPWAAFQIAKASKNRRPKTWDEDKVALMRQIILAKLEQNEDVQERLQSTGDRMIIENSPWDPFWGVGPNGDGQNNLGKLWSELRKTTKR
ncbi:MAG: hypothetical protein QG629_269 [Patescibacteria group bacterium]|nr:NADAR family protein [Candidatus Saccharibacteria bacterium]MDQ5963187.1 hypothetical protein [Patescibacteria group bacterium]